MNETKWIAHHGILGQKWGVRRYQNPDGSLTEAGKRHLQKKIAYDEMDRQDYMPLKGKNISARKKVAEEYEVESDKLRKKYFTKDGYGDLKLKYKYSVYKNHGKIDEFTDLSKKYTEKYADAALKDMKMLATEPAKTYVKQILVGYNYIDYDQAELDDDQKWKW